ncbi:cell division cycle 7-related protein kinase isoform X1 [Rhipicephalus sanguineus]|uniref:cell division cycle 7-related protein kinase isoform X1 n=1 Tax=Rhipicephalus sanguineus TaxID=34632 RepID=UPI00189448F1|nr:cell division cycle 7-related protein kinase isoform X1 [Rhipicephalus sanguineus]
MAVQVLKPFEKVAAEQEYRRQVGLVKTLQSTKASSAMLSANATNCSDDSVCLYSYIPQVQKHFILDGKIGEGTFSHVYKARLKASAVHMEFAIKFLIPTSHPSRIANELQCLREIGGSSNVMDVKMCFLHKGHVAIVMPYFPHEKFPDFVYKLTVTEVQEYMMQLFIALRRVHSFNIIHRDIKPSNFLYSRKCKRFSLVDFGLAQRLGCVSGDSEPKASGPLLKDLGPSQNPPSRKRTRTLDQENQKAQVKRQCLPAHMGPPLHTINVHNVSKAATAAGKLQQTTAASAKPTSKGVLNQARRGRRKLCCCFGRNEVCNICLSRPAEIAPRAGTPGFRAPEVLLKYRNQTTAVDMWSAGVIFLSLLSGRYPFFRAQDDLTALAEIITVIGSIPVQLAAEKMGKLLTVSHEKPVLDLKSLCERLRGTRVKIGQTADGVEKAHFRYHESWLHVPDSAYDLLYKLLDPDPTTRITAEDALKHDFIKELLC